MTGKPATAAGYSSGQVARVKATCLYLATKLGDLMPEMVVVGGLVPALLIDQQNLQDNVMLYVGTIDVDLGLAFALVGDERYQGHNQYEHALHDVWGVMCGIQGVN